LWICSLLWWCSQSYGGGTQSVSCGGVLTNWKSVTASIIHGSGIGPSLFIVYSKDLKPLSVHNTILKYADDTSLLVPQNSSVTLETEFAHLLDWSKKINCHLFDIDTLIHKFDHQLFRSVQYPHHCLHHYFLKNAPLTILGNSDLEVMITLSAKSILPPSKLPFLVNVCLPVFSAVTLYCVLYILYVLPLYYVVFMFWLFT